MAQFISEGKKVVQEGVTSSSFEKPSTVAQFGTMLPLEVVSAVSVNTKKVLKGPLQFIMMACNPSNTPNLIPFSCIGKGSIQPSGRLSRSTGLVLLREGDEGICQGLCQTQQGPAVVPQVKQCTLKLKKTDLFMDQGAKKDSDRLIDSNRAPGQSIEPSPHRTPNILASQSPCERGEIQAMECIPTLFTIEQPAASNYVRMHSLWAYVVHFVPGSDQLDRVQRYTIKEGKLHDPANNKPLVMECDREAYFYFSHRDDLLSLDQGRWFKKDKSGLPLLGPFTAPRGPYGKLELNIWDQNDWAIVRGPYVDGVRPDGVTMSEWKDNYNIGKFFPLKKGGLGFFPHGSNREKERQEQWKGTVPKTIDLVHLGNPGGDAMWAGTISALPSDKAKLHMIHNGPHGSLHVGSYNEIAPTGKNQDFPGHHVYNQSLVRLLLALPASDQPGSEIDALPAPPTRCLLPGDICWQDQGQTNNCGTYSFSFVMNYWMPYTNNPARKDGALYAQPGNVDDTINGARTPDDIVNAANKFKMRARDNDAEELNRPRALKLLKLWIQAGVPVMVLVEEEYNVWSLHWKTIVGYDGNRIFLNNSGADAEVIIAQRTPGVNYVNAPVGNDVDSETAHWNKWKAAGGDILDLITSVDECTFIPIFPNDPMFSGGSVL